MDRLRRTACLIEVVQIPKDCTFTWGVVIILSQTLYYKLSSYYMVYLTWGSLSEQHKPNAVGCHAKHDRTLNFPASCVTCRVSAHLLLLGHVLWFMGHAEQRCQEAMCAPPPPPPPTACAQASCRARHDESDVFKGCFIHAPTGTYVSNFSKLSRELPVLVIG